MEFWRGTVLVVVGWGEVDRLVNSELGDSAGIGIRCASRNIPDEYGVERDKSLITSEIWYLMAFGYAS
jgi:hypothetical protein